ncbi:hypothetical protein [Dokdonella soli]|uniref:Uncharacterized protein n=1 Tax=Dokdonella soli TaxID=529810 RepID=A0ABN1IC78_9GAMM
MSDDPLSNALDAARGGRNWDALAALIAAMIGVMALLVSGYTAYIQRQQVRAQVWPYLMAGWADFEQSRIVINKGVGPAQVRSVEMLVDGKPQPDWPHVIAALGLPGDFSMNQSTINSTVVSAGEKVAILKLEDKEQYRRFRAGIERMTLRICYCSTLGDCWMHEDHRRRDQGEEQVAECPRLPEDRVFNE